MNTMEEVEVVPSGLLSEDFLTIRITAATLIGNGNIRANGGQSKFQLQWNVNQSS